MSERTFTAAEVEQWDTYWNEESITDYYKRKDREEMEVNADGDRIAVMKAVQEKFPSQKNNVEHISATDPNTNPIGVWGGNFSVPAKTFKEIGGYDEGYDVGWGGEENDLVKRCVKAGCRVQWVKDSEIFHLDHPIKAYARTMLGSQKYVKELT